MKDTHENINTTAAPEEVSARAMGGEVRNEMLLSLFRRAVKTMMRAHHHQGHAEYAQMRVLAILRRNEPMSQKDLLEMLHVRSASLSELLGKLEQRNLISRVRDEKDKRNIIISLTEEGAAAADNCEATRRESLDAIFGTLSETEREQLAGLLTKVIDSLEQHVVEHHSHQHDHDDDEHRHHHRHGRHGSRCRRGRFHDEPGREEDDE